MDTSDIAERYNVEAVERFVRISALFSAARPALSLNDIAHLAGIPLRTTSKILATLEHHDLLVREPESGLFRPGFAWLRIGEAKRRSINVREAAFPAMRRLRDELNETIILSVRIGDLRINVDYVESTQPLRRVTQRGSEMPLHVGAGGRTLLAGLSDEEVEAYLSRAELVNYGYDTPTDPKFIWRDVRSARSRGYLVARNEITEASASVSAPIKDYAERTLGVLTIGCPLSRFTKAFEKTCTQRILETTRSISAVLGRRI